MLGKPAPERSERFHLTDPLFLVEIICVASPQLENGYTSIANEILEALWKVNLSPYEYRVLLYLLRKTYGWQKKTDRITLSQFAKDIGIDRRLIFRAIKKLSSKQMIVIYKDDKNRLSYGFQKDYDKWTLSSKKMTVIYRDDKVSSKEMTKLSSKQIPTKENIINYTKENIYTNRFDIFWREYPKKIGKGYAKKIWMKLKPSQELLEKMLSTLKAYKETEQWKKERGKYIPHPSTWLNQGRWEDEIETIRPEPQPIETGVPDWIKEAIKDGWKG